MHNYIIVIIFLFAIIYYSIDWIIFEKKRKSDYDKQYILLYRRHRFVMIVLFILLVMKFGASIV